MRIDYLLHLKSNSLDLVSADGKVVRKLHFPPLVVSHLEISDPRQFDTLLTKLFSGLTLRKKFLIILHDSVLFIKQLTELSPESLHSFLDLVPLEPEDILHLSVTLHNKVFALGTPKKLTRALEIFLENSEGKVIAALPQPFLPHLVSKNSLSDQDIPYLSTRVASLSGLDLLSAGLKKSRRTRSYRHQVALALLVIALFSLATTVFVFRKRLLPSPTAASDQPPPISATPTPSPAPSATPMPELNVYDLKIRVLNGTSTPGLASSAADYLISFGYGNVTAANAPEDTVTETLISLKTPSPEVFEELFAALSSRFSVSSQSAILDPSSPFDAVITLGL